MQCRHQLADDVRIFDTSGPPEGMDFVRLVRLLVVKRRLDVAETRPEFSSDSIVQHILDAHALHVQDPCEEFVPDVEGTWIEALDWARHPERRHAWPVYVCAHFAAHGCLRVFQHLSDAPARSLCYWDSVAVNSASAAGHVHVLQYMLQCPLLLGRPSPDAVNAAAENAQLAALRFLRKSGFPCDDDSLAAAVRGAARRPDLLQQMLKLLADHTPRAVDNAIRAAIKCDAFHVVHTLVGMSPRVEISHRTVGAAAARAANNRDAYDFVLARVHRIVPADLATGRVVTAVAESGNLALVLEMLAAAASSAFVDRPAVLRAAARRGDVDLCAWTLRRRRADTDIVCIAAANAHLRLVRLLLAASACPWPVPRPALSPRDVARVVVAAVDSGDILFVQTILETLPLRSVDADPVAHATTLPMALLLRQHGFAWSPAFGATLARLGHTADLKRARQLGCPVDEGTVAGAAAAGNLDLLKDLVATAGTSVGVRTLRAAATSGSVGVLRWCIDTVPDIPRDASVLCEAVRNGHVAFVEASLKLGFRIDPSVCEAAVRQCQWELLCRHGAPFMGYIEACAGEDARRLVAWLRRAA